MQLAKDNYMYQMIRCELVDAVETLDTDQIADLVDDLPPDVMAEVQEGLSHEERAQLRAAMSYPEDSVGARMDFDMVSIREEVTIDMVLRYLRRFKTLPDHMDQVFVVNRFGQLRGVISVAQILTSDPSTQVKRIMQTEAFTLNPLDDAGEAAQAFERYDLVSAAVVDEAGRLVGRLTVNEVVDVIREESEEDAYAAVGLDDELDLGVGHDVVKARGHAGVRDAVGQLEDATHLNGGHPGGDDLVHAASHRAVAEKGDLHVRPIFRVCVRRPRGGDLGL